MQLIEEEYMRDILMIGGIGVFLPFSQGEAEFYVVTQAVTLTVRPLLPGPSSSHRPEESKSSS
jgi:hypothetical protein